MRRIRRVCTGVPRLRLLAMSEAEVEAGQVEVGPLRQSTTRVLAWREREGRGWGWNHFVNTSRFGPVQIEGRRSDRALEAD